MITLEDGIYAGTATPSSGGGGGGGSSKKYGMTIDDVFGDVSGDKLQFPTGGSFDLKMDNITGVAAGMTGFMAYKFYGNKNIHSASFANLTNAGSNPSFTRAFQSSSLVSLSLPKLQAIDGSAMCIGCASLTSVDFSGLLSIGYQGLDSAFQNCTALTSISFPEVTTIGYGGISSICSGCTALTSISFPKLASVTGANMAAFRQTGLVSVVFPVLSNIGYSQACHSWFHGCASLTSVSFPALTSTSFGNSTNQFNNMLYQCSGVTVHFPSNVQSVIGSWNDVTNGFGGTNTTVLFDLPATE